MAWGLEYFVGLDIFSYGWFNWVFFIGFFLIFSYVGLRATEEKPWHAALKLVACTLVVALLLAFTSIPSFWSGIIIVIAYTLIRRHLFKPTLHSWITSFIALWFILIILALIPVAYTLVFSIFLLIYFYWVSEMDIKSLKKGKSKEDDKEKKN